VQLISEGLKGSFKCFEKATVCPNLSITSGGKHLKHVPVHIFGKFTSGREF
jgi:hypothetical protein